MDTHEVRKGEFYSQSGHLVVRSDLEEEFDAVEYLKFTAEAETFLDIRKFVQYKLQCLHQSCSTLPDGVKVLDYGAGPHIASIISAAGKASEIMMTDILPQNRAQLSYWLNKDENAFDWSAYFTYVVQELEGKDHVAIKGRESKVRQLVKAVVHCDITKDPPIEEGYDYLYDVVICSLVIEAAVDSPEEYRSAFTRLASLVKAGGSLFLYGVESDTGCYTIGTKSFPCAYITNEFAMDVFKNSGFSDVMMSTLDGGDRVFRFIRGTKDRV